MMEDLMRDLQVLWKADSLIGRIWLGVLARRFALTVFAALVAVFGLGMANLAGLYGMQPSYGPVWSAVIVAAVDFVLAALVLAYASRARPGPELELALEVRKMAVASLQSDAAAVGLAAESLRNDIRQTTDRIAGFVQNPVGSAAEQLLVPAALSLLRGLRANKGKA